MKEILLVEDDSFLVDIYTTKLKESGFSVDVATDGEECLKKINEKKFDLIVLDVVLPKYDGWEILKFIRSTENLKSLPVILLSNLGQKGEVEKGLELGANKYLIKAHYTPSEIVDQIKEIFQ